MGSFQMASHCIGCFPGEILDNGMRVLHDDSLCKLMAYCITGSEVADVYVKSMEIHIEAFADDERSDAEENNIIDPVIEVGDGT